MLKTDYKDDVFEGDRQYSLTQNANNTISLRDVTTYTREGDQFGADDINAANTEVNRLNHVTPVTLTAAGWTGSAAPYTQTVSVPGTTSDMEPILVSALAEGATEAVQKAYIKVFGIICSGTATVGNGTATFRVYKKPTTNATVGLKGV